METRSVKIGLKFPPIKADKPVITRLVECNLTFNILKASISPGNKGTAILEITGTEENIQRGMDSLKNEGVNVKVYTDSVIHYEEQCMHCGACTSVCPTGALVMNQDTWELEFQMDKCVLCGHCVRACPARAIKSFEEAAL